MLGNKIYRREALNKISSPERMDELVVILSPRLWLGLLAVLVIMLLAGVWGWFGRIDTKVNGSGILLKVGGIRTVVGRSSGVISYLTVNVNTPVSQGEVLGVLDLPVLELEIKQLEDKYLLLEKQFRELAEREKKNSKLHSEYFDITLKDTDSTLEKLQSAQSHFQEIADMFKSLRQKRVMSKTSYYQQLSNLVDAEVNVNKQLAAKHKLPVERFDFEIKQNDLLNSKIRELTLVKNELQIKRQTYVTKALLISPVTGTVMNITKKPGDSMTEGEVVIQIMSRAEDDLRLDAYISIVDGKKIKKNQLVYISPTNLLPQRFGYILGVVSSVNVYPETEKAMVAELKNQDLIKYLKANAPAVIKAGITLLPDPENPEGLKWSCRNSENIAVAPGTPCNVMVVVERRPPITYVMPWLREKLLGTGRDLPLNNQNQELNAN